MDIADFHSPRLYEMTDPIMKATVKMNKIQFYFLLFSFFI